MRHHTFDSILTLQRLKGVMFMIDAADLSDDSEAGSLRQTAEYLHDLLLVLQNRSTKRRPAKATQELPVLIAANKLDLFTALPAALVKTLLESEITKIRTSRDKGLLDSGVEMDRMDVAEESGWLGDGGGRKFEFSQMEEVGIPIVVLGGNVAGSDGPDVQKWWDWFGDNL